MSNNPINTIPIQQFIQQVKSAELSQVKELRLDMKTAKQLAFTLGEVTSKLTQDYDNLIHILKNSNNDVVQVELDGGGFSDKN
jgi:hypothetical protein